MNKIEAAKNVLRELNNLNESEKERFSEISNKLLQVNYFVKKDKYLDDYLFLYKYRELFYSYFALSDFTFGIDEKFQVVYLKNNSDYNKLNLKKLESILLLAFRILYHRKNEKVTLIDEVEINLTDLHTEIERVGYSVDDERIKRSELVPILQMLKRYNIIDFIVKELNDDSRIIIYPSILYAVDFADIKETLDMFKAYKVSEDDEYEIIENQTD